MKYLVLLLLITAGTTTFAQTQITATEKRATMSKGTYNAFSAEIPQGVLKDVIRDWKRHLTSTCKGKQTDVNGEIALKGGENKSIYATPFNIYSQLASTKMGVSLTVWFTADDSIYFSSTNEKTAAAAARRLVSDFATAEYFLAVRDAYKDEKDKLEKLKDQLEKQIREEETSSMKIADNKRAIARAQEDLQVNDSDQKQLAAQMAMQQNELNKARGQNGDTYKEAEKALKNLDDESKKLKSQSEALHKKIDEKTKENTGEERDVTNSRTAQKQSQDAIEKQKLIIKDLEAKLKAIK